MDVSSWELRGLVYLSDSVCVRMFGVYVFVIVVCGFWTLLYFASGRSAVGMFTECCAVGLGISRS